MIHIKEFELFEWNIPGDPVGDGNMMNQTLRIPDTISINRINDEWNKPIKRKKKKRYIKNAVQKKSNI